MTENDRLFLENLKAFLDRFGIRLVETPNNPDAFLQVMVQASLLPSDALIVAACRHHGITKIATFDSDFLKLGDLEVLGD